MSDTAEMSLADLQLMLKKQQARVQNLMKKREKLEEQIREMDDEIASLTGTETGKVRFRNKQSLEEVICEILGKNKKGLALAELTEAVEKTGYQSDSNNFKNVVYQNLYKSELVQRDEKTGKYVLK